MEPGPRHPTEPPTTGWQFPTIDEVDPDGLVAVGADLAPGTLLKAYRSGFFPMPVGEPSVMGWWSPDPRGIIEPSGFHVSRSLRRSLRRFSITINTSFDRVVEACADPARPHGWITDEIRAAYGELHRLGWAHSIEVWGDDDLAGGLYGVGIGAFFAGESMFHHQTDASKAAVAALIEVLRPHPQALFDVQWVTGHLSTLGARPMGRSAYLGRLELATQSAGPDWPMG